MYFFSFLSDGNREYYIPFDKGLEVYLQGLNPLTHSSIAAYFGICEDNTNKYEFDPFGLTMLKVKQNLEFNDVHYITEKFTSIFKKMPTYKIRQIRANYNGIDCIYDEKGKQGKFVKYHMNGKIAVKSWYKDNEKIKQSKYYDLLGNIIKSKK